MGWSSWDIHFKKWWRAKKCLILCQQVSSSVNFTTLFTWMNAVMRIFTSLVVYASRALPVVQKLGLIKLWMRCSHFPFGIKRKNTWSWLKYLTTVWQALYSSDIVTWSSKLFISLAEMLVAVTLLCASFLNRTFHCIVKICVWWSSGGRSFLP